MSLEENIGILYTSKRELTKSTQTVIDTHAPHPVLVIAPKSWQLESSPIITSMKVNLENVFNPLNEESLLNFNQKIINMIEKHSTDDIPFNSIVSSVVTSNDTKLPPISFNAANISKHLLLKISRLRPHLFIKLFDLFTATNIRYLIVDDTHTRSTERIFTAIKNVLDETSNSNVYISKVARIDIELYSHHLLASYYLNNKSSDTALTHIFNKNHPRHHYPIDRNNLGVAYFPTSDSIVTLPIYSDVNQYLDYSSSFLLHKIDISIDATVISSLIWSDISCSSIQPDGSRINTYLAIKYRSTDDRLILRVNTIPTISEPVGDEPEFSSDNELEENDLEDKKDTTLVERRDVVEGEFFDRVLESKTLLTLMIINKKSIIFYPLSIHFKNPLSLMLSNQYH